MRAILLLLFLGTSLTACDSGALTDSLDTETAALRSSETSVLVQSGDVASKGGEKFTICHVPPGNPPNAHFISVGSRNAVDMHVENHAGDFELTPGMMMTCPMMPGGGD